MIEEPHPPRKQSAGTSQTSLAAAVIGQSSLGSNNLMDVRVACSPRAHINTALTVPMSKKLGGECKAETNASTLVGVTSHVTISAKNHCK